METTGMTLHITLENMKPKKMNYNLAYNCNIDEKK